MAFCNVGCNLINPDEEVPSYIEIRGIKTSSNYITQGTSSSKVTDVWVYAGGSYIGTYQLPAKFPILLSGKHKITLGAGIMANGIASTREFYPLYKFYDVDLDLIPGQITTVDTFNVDYFTGLQYTWYEDFEKDTSGGGISLDTTNLSFANILPDSLDVFEGKRSLKLKVTTAATVVECVTVGDGYQLTKGRDIYLEMNYKCSQPFQVGLLGETFIGERSIPVIRFNTETGWNKIYLRLGPYINANGDVLKFKIYFRMDLATGATEGVAYLDNLKLISN